MLAVALTEQEHQFGDGGFGGHVARTNHTHLCHAVAGIVAPHLYGTAHALGDVDDDDAAFYGMFQSCDEPVGGHGVARAEGLHHHATQTGYVQNALNHVATDAGEEHQHHHVGAHLEVRFEGCAVCRVVYVVVRIVDVHTNLGYLGEVGRRKGIEALGVDLLGAIAAQQRRLEVDAHLGHHGTTDAVARGSYLDRRDEVFFAIGAQHAHGQLRPGEDHRLVEVFEHVAQRRGGVGHRVGAVQHHKAVIHVVAIGNDMRQAAPVLGCDVARVERRVELHGAI